MPPPCHPLRRRLPFADWPEADRRAWERALQPGDILTDAGPGAHWRPATRQKYQAAYGRWLRFRFEDNAAARDLSPAERLTPDWFSRYLDFLRPLLCSRSLWSESDALCKAIGAMAPDGDWDWFHAVVRRLQRQARPKKPIGPYLLPAETIFATGFRLMAEAVDRPPRLPLDQSTWFRDGLMLALLAAIPVRLGNFASIALECHLLRQSSGYRLWFPADEVKTHRELEYPVPNELTPGLDRYLAHHRVQLLQGHASDALWISNLGRAMPASSISHRIRVVTARAFGHAVTPHLFRHCAATSIAEEDPEHARIIAPLLGHSGLTMADRHYNKAAMVEAGRRHAAIVDDLRRAAKAGRKRKGTPPCAP